MKMLLLSGMVFSLIAISIMYILVELDYRKNLEENAKIKRMLYGLDREGHNDR